jgi:hypothetical protein
MQKKSPGTNNQQLGNLIERYKKIIKPPQQTVVKEVIIVVKEITNLQLQESNVTYSVPTKTIHLTVSGIVKTEIKKQQSQIIKKLTERLGEQQCPTVIL